MKPFLIFVEEHQSSILSFVLGHVISQGEMQRLGYKTFVDEMAHHVSPEVLHKDWRQAITIAEQMKIRNTHLLPEAIKISSRAFGYLSELESCKKMLEQNLVLHQVLIKHGLVIKHGDSCLQQPRMEEAFFNQQFYLGPVNDVTKMGRFETALVKYRDFVLTKSFLDNLEGGFARIGLFHAAGIRNVLTILLSKEVVEQYFQFILIQSESPDQEAQLALKEYRRIAGEELLTLTLDETAASIEKVVTLINAFSSTKDTLKRDKFQEFSAHIDKIESHLSSFCVSDSFSHQLAAFSEYVNNKKGINNLITALSKTLIQQRREDLQENYEQHHHTSFCQKIYDITTEHARTSAMQGIDNLCRKYSDALRSPTVLPLQLTSPLRFLHGPIPAETHLRYQSEIKRFSGSDYVRCLMFSHGPLPDKEHPQYQTEKQRLASSNYSKAFTSL